MDGFISGLDYFCTELYCPVHFTFELKQGGFVSGFQPCKGDFLCPQLSKVKQILHTYWHS